MRLIWLKLPRPPATPWLDREFGWKERTAQNFIQVFEASKSVNFTDLDLPVSSLYLLAAPSTPETARDAVLASAALRGGNPDSGRAKCGNQEIEKSKSSPGAKALCRWAFLNNLN